MELSINLHKEACSITINDKLRLTIDTADNESFFIDAYTTKGFLADSICVSKEALNNNNYPKN